MPHFFRQPDRRQCFLLPVDMMDWLPEADIVHLVVDAVGLMDLREFEATCKVGRAGQPRLAPSVLLALLIYAYSHGVRSSRAIERLCRRDAGYRFIVGKDALRTIDIEETEAAIKSNAASVRTIFALFLRTMKAIEARWIEVLDVEALGLGDNIGDHSAQALARTKEVPSR